MTLSKLLQISELLKVLKVLKCRSPAAVLTLLGAVLLATQVQAQGTLERIRVHGPSLAGNLEGDDPEREVFVYLPQGYADSDRAYPVVYFLHGYAVQARVYVEDVLHLPESVDAAVAAGAEPAIIVMPDAFTRFGGSFYSNSPTIGDWESYIARDLVSYIDSHYRTQAGRAGRGLAGHSMGGYGTLRVGMRYPEVFAALYSMSAGGLFDPVPDRETVARERERMAQGIQTEARSMVNGMEAKAAAWVPNPQKPPYYFDLPYEEDGTPVPLVEGRWNANALLLTVDRNVPALQSFRGLRLDVGDEDNLESSNSRFAAALERLGVEHSYEIYQGNHGNRVGQRFIDEVLPFFAGHLDAD